MFSYFCGEIVMVMSRKEKLIERFKTQPKDFTFNELTTLLSGLGFVICNKGKTSGSRVKFHNLNTKTAFILHKPHKTGEPVNEATMKEILDNLTINNLI